MDQYLDSVKEFIDQFPKTKQELLKWQKKNLQGMQQQMVEGIPEEDVSIPEITDDMAEQMLYVSLMANHRFLFDFFDEQKIKVFLKDRGASVAYEVDGMESKSTYSTRIEAEQAGFKEAMDKFERNEVKD